MINMVLPMYALIWINSVVLSKMHFLGSYFIILMQGSSGVELQERQLQQEDDDLARAISLSLKVFIS